MTDIELVNGKLYWIRCQLRIGEYIVRLAEYVDYEGMKWFNLFGTDEGEEIYRSEVLGKAELIIPDYAKDTGYGD